ncbi:MAG: TOBE domain-containing protein, partial [Xanthomonadales bacterium]|nr:TOBE domain-containing protein [Xanthomonadales bacterium]
VGNEVTELLREVNFLCKREGVQYFEPLPIQYIPLSKQVLECAQQAPDQARGYRVVVECDFTRQQWTCWHHQALAKKQAMDLMVRPEQLREVRAPNGENHCEAQGVSVRYLGDHSVHELCYAGHLPLRMKGVDTQAISAASPDHQYHLAWSYDAACLLPRGELVDG